MIAPPVQTARSVRITWDEGLFKQGRTMQLTPVALGDGGTAFKGWVQRFAQARWFDSSTGRSALQTSAAYALTRALDSDGTRGLKVTHRANSAYEHAREGELSVWVDFKGLRDDVRWRGRIVGAPAPIQAILAAAKLVDQTAW